MWKQNRGFCAAKHIESTFRLKIINFMKTLIFLIIRIGHTRLSNIIVVINPQLHLIIDRFF